MYRVLYDVMLDDEVSMLGAAILCYDCRQEARGKTSLAGFVRLTKDQALLLAPLAVVQCAVCYYECMVTD